MALASDDPTLTSAEHIGGAPAGEQLVAPPVSPRGDVWRRFRRNRMAMFGLVVIVAIVLAAVFADVITGPVVRLFGFPSYEPGRVDTDARNIRPFFRDDHILGTDRLGRDMFTDIIYGARVSLRIGLAGGLIAGVVGTTVGAIAGFFGRWSDTLIMRLTDIMLSLPYILLALAIATVMGRGEGTVIFVVGSLGWMHIARVLRASILQVRELEYIEAARALGFGRARLILRHILPNTIQPVIVYTTLFIGAAVITEAALSFLGVGIQRPTPAWGLMVKEGRTSLATYPHMLFEPAGALSILVIAALLVGDGLRDALDPRLR